MKRIEFLDKAAEREATFDEIGVFYKFGRAYFTAIVNGNERIDFSDAIHESDVDPILAECRRFGVTEFTVSSGFSSIVERIAAFEDGGCRLEGMVKVKGDFNAFGTQKRIILPAFLLRVLPEGGAEND